MTSRCREGLRITAAIALAALLAACAANRTLVAPRYYVLEAGHAAPAAVVATGLRIAIGPIDVAAYLDQPLLVTRRAGHEVSLNEYDRWAMPLRHNITDVLRGSLRQILPGASTSAFPGTLAEPYDYRVMVEVTRFDGVLGETAELVADWRIVAADGARLSNAAGRFEKTSVPAGISVEELVASQSGLLTEFAASLGAVLAALDRSVSGGEGRRQDAGFPPAW